MKTSSPGPFKCDQNLRGFSVRRYYRLIRLVGFGLNPNGSNIKEAGMWAIQSSGTVADMYGVNKDQTIWDTENGGSDDLYVSSHTPQTGGGYLTTFYRDLDTGDDSDIVLNEGEDYTLIWAYGQSSSTTFLKHSGSDCGDSDITLSSTYSGDDTGSAYYFTGVFGLICDGFQLAY